MYGLYFLPCSNFAPFEEVKVPVSDSADFPQKSAPWRTLEDLGWLGLMSKQITFNWLTKQDKTLQAVRAHASRPRLTSDRRGFPFLARCQLEHAVRQR